MLLILISWIYIIFLTINLGVLLDKLAQLKNTNFIIYSILGLFTTTILASIWAIFGRINIEFHVFLLFLNVLLFFNFKKKVLVIYKSFYNDLQSLHFSLKILLSTIVVLIIAQCATVPYLIDNESYYIQTIKWINEYGFVKGLVNLHLFFGQVSGWHVTQSALNFSFLYSNFNDLSGFCLLLGTIFSIQKLNQYYKNQEINNLTIGLLPLYTVFFFQFISAPSPDIPVYIFSFVLFYYFLENLKKVTIEGFNLILILTLFILYIKSTAISLVLIPILLFIINFRLLSKNIGKTIGLSLTILILFVTKNMIICGVPFFPTKMFEVIKMDYAVPKSIQYFYSDQLNYYGYFVDMNQYNSMTATDLFLRWLSLPKMNGLFNKISVLLVLIVPFFIYKFQNKKGFWIIYTLMLVQLLTLFLTSPQYRFLLNYIFFFLTFSLACLIQNKKTITFLLYFSLIPTLIVLFIPINLNRFSNNKFMLEVSTFDFNNIIYPYKNTKNNTVFRSIHLGNLIYNSPVDENFFWSNGNGDLPCVNKEQINYFEKYFHIIPQMRTTNLKDGFYAKTISDE